MPRYGPSPTASSRRFHPNGMPQLSIALPASRPGLRRSSPLRPETKRSMRQTAGLARYRYYQSDQRVTEPVDVLLLRPLGLDDKPVPHLYAADDPSHVGDAFETEVGPHAARKSLGDDAVVLALRNDEVGLQLRDGGVASGSTAQEHDQRADAGVERADEARRGAHPIVRVGDRGNCQ